MELGQLVAGDDQMIRPLLCDDHQMGHAPADVVAAHGQGQRCREKRAVMWTGLQLTSDTLAVFEIVPHHGYSALYRVFATYNV